MRVQKRFSSCPCPATSSAMLCDEFPTAVPLAGSCPPHALQSGAMLICHCWRGCRRTPGVSLLRAQLPLLCLTLQLPLLPLSHVTL